MTPTRCNQGHCPPPLTRSRRLAVPGVVAMLTGGLLLGACTEPTGTSSTGGFLAVVPEEVVALAGPGQNLDAVQFNDQDRCYWYLHRGPVEDTMLPLRTAAGNPICAAKEA